MTPSYEPELGQALFGSSYGEFPLPDHGLAAVRMVLNEMQRVYGNRYGYDSSINFGSNDGFELPKGALGPDIQYRAYYWGDAEEEESKPNLTFDGVEICWYKHADRGTSCNIQMTPDEWAHWLQKALQYLRSWDVQL